MANICESKTRLWAVYRHKNTKYILALRVKKENAVSLKALKQKMAEEIMRVNILMQAADAMWQL